MSAEGPSKPDPRVERKTSAAKRLRVAFQHLNSFAPNKPMYLHWARILKIVPSDPSQPQLVATEVARQLSLIGRQIDLLEQHFKNSLPTLSPNTTTHQSHRLRLILASCLSNLQAPWANLQSELTPDLLKSLEFWDELIPGDENEIEDPRIQEVDELLDEAEQRARSSLDPELAAVLVKIIESLRKAMRDGVIGGEAEFQRNFRDACAEALKNHDLIRKNNGTQEVSTLEKAWKKFNDVFAPLVAADGLLSAGSRLVQLGGAVVKLLG